MTAITTYELANPTTETGRDAVQTSQEWIDRLVADSGGDDTKLLQNIKEHIEICQAHLAAIRSLRSEAIVRQRAAGKSNVQLAEDAGLSDSGVSRAAIGAGGQRRFERRTGPPDRRMGAPGRRSSGSP